jgi:protein TonB
MGYSVKPYINRNLSNGFPFWVVFVASILFHGFLFIALPFLTSLLWKSEKFNRPATFQLVSLPSPQKELRRIPVPKDTPKQKVAKKEKVEAPKKVPGPTTAKNKKDADKQEDPKQSVDENIDELASLLDELPAPVQISALGNFKYPWYLNIVRNKIETFWNPTSENKNLKVIVAFTIFSDGSISEPVVVKSSGNSSIDNLALRAVKMAAPFGRLPPGFTGDKLELNCTLIPTRK